jgi:hypothetical protein
MTCSVVSAPVTPKRWRGIVRRQPPWPWFMGNRLDEPDGGIATTWVMTVDVGQICLAFASGTVAETRLSGSRTERPCALSQARTQSTASFLANAHKPGCLRAQWLIHRGSEDPSGEVVAEAWRGAKAKPTPALRQLPRAQRGKG